MTGPTMGTAKKDAVVRIIWTDPELKLAEPSLDDCGTISQVLVVGRPVHPFTKGEGNHTTSWMVLVDRIRRELVGLRVQEAVWTLRNLVLDNVDAAEASERLSGRRWELYAEAYDRATGAFERAHAAVKTARKLLKNLRDYITTDTQNTTEEIQRIKGEALANITRTKDELRKGVAAYLTLRNLEPLSAAYLGPGQSVAGSERSALAALRRYEVKRKGDPKDLIKAIWNLLDLNTIHFALGSPTDRDSRETFPGLDINDVEGSAAKIVLRHLREVTHAYPLAYMDSGLCEALRTDMATLNSDLRRVFRRLRYLPGAPARGTAPEGWSGSGDVLVAFSLSDEDGDDPRIVGVEAEGRGPTLLGRDTQGHHLTSHAAIIRAVKRTLAGKTLIEAGDDMFALASRVRELPTFPPARQNRHRLGPQDDPKGIFAEAWVRVEVLLREMEGETALKYDPDMIAELATAYLALRNALPLATTNYGAIPNNQNEQRAIAKLDAFEESKSIDAGTACGALWATLDVGNLVQIYGGKKATYFMPGAPSKSLDRVIAIFKVHQATIKVAWPRCYHASQWQTKASLRYGLRRTLLDLDQREFDTICKALEIAEEGTVEPFFKYDPINKDTDVYMHSKGTDRIREPSSRKAGKPKWYGEWLMGSQSSLPMEEDMGSQSQGSSVSSQESSSPMDAGEGEKRAQEVKGDRPHKRKRTDSWS